MQYPLNLWAGLRQATGEGTAEERGLRERRIYRDYLKRGFDIVLVLIALPLALPLIGLVVICLLCSGGAPVFGHWRIGRGGKPFRCWKLRSMVRDAEARLSRYLAENAAARQEWDEFYKLRKDPRITWLGQFLRQSSIDELPQLFNVLVGEMSCVGPRPVTAAEEQHYGSAHLATRVLRPGLTGLWQVSGRNELSWRRRVEMDLRYLQDCSFRLDLKIILLTFCTLCRGSGR